MLPLPLLRADDVGQGMLQRPPEARNSSFL